MDRGRPGVVRPLEHRLPGELDRPGGGPPTTGNRRDPRPQRHRAGRAGGAGRRGRRLAPGRRRRLGVAPATLTPVVDGLAAGRAGAPGAGSGRPEGGSADDHAHRAGAVDLDRGRGHRGAAGPHAAASGQTNGRSCAATCSPCWPRWIPTTSPDQQGRAGRRTAETGRAVIGHRPPGVVVGGRTDGLRAGGAAGAAGGSGTVSPAPVISWALSTAESICSSCPANLSLGQPAPLLECLVDLLVVLVEQIAVRCRRDPWASLWPSGRPFQERPHHRACRCLVGVASRPCS